MQLSLMVLGSILSLVSGAALIIFQRAKSGRDERDREVETRLRCLEQAQAAAITESRFREIIKDELQSLELRLINEGRLAPRSHRGSQAPK
jgi:type II secretory pathway pseudopilin PulG